MMADKGEVMKSGRARWLAWFLGALAMAFTGLGLLFLFKTRSTPIPESWGFRGFEAIFAVSSSSIGVLVAPRYPRNPIGWLACALGLLSGAQLFLEEYSIYTLLAYPGSLPAGMAIAWVQHWIWVLPVSLTGTFLLMLFPNGRLLSPRWRPLPWLAAVAMATIIIGFGLVPAPLQNLAPITNPLGTEGIAPQLLMGIGFLLLVGAIFLSATSLVLRLRRAQGEERQQLKWVAYAASLVAVFMTTGFLPGYFKVVSELAAEVAEFLSILSIAGLIAAVGIAILKYRLYDIDLIINRTLVYVPLTAILAGLYTASIGLFQRLFVSITGEKSDAAIVLTTLVVAAAFTPVKNSLQGFIDKRFKEIQDPTKELKAYGERVRSVVQVLDVERNTRQLLEEAARAFQAESGAVFLEKNGRLEMLQTFGRWGGEARLSVPLEADGVRYGLISLGHRRQGLDYTAQDREALRQIAELTAKAISLSRKG